LSGVIIASLTTAALGNLMMVMNMSNLSCPCLFGVLPSRMPGDF
jgi:hypothetical protein